MENKLFCEYKFKFYLNASHSIVINGNQGQIHPHTWEISLDILVPKSDFTEFNEYEKAIENFFKQYQNKTINSFKPFDTIIPTLENMIDYFGNEIREIVHTTGGELAQIEGSETPTRSYVVSYIDDSEYVAGIQQYSEKSLSRVFDKVLDEGFGNSNGKKKNSSANLGLWRANSPDKVNDEEMPDLDKKEIKGFKYACERLVNAVKNIPHAIYIIFAVIYGIYLFIMNRQDKTRSQ